MSACGNAVTSAVTSCKNATSDAEQKCVQETNAASSQCAQATNAAASQCAQWASEASSACAQWANEFSASCSFDNCHWYEPWNCIADALCQGVSWLANLLCQTFVAALNALCQTAMAAANMACQTVLAVVNAICTTIWAVVTMICAIIGSVVTVFCVVVTAVACSLRSAAGAIARAPGRRRKGPQIEHVFVLMLENRSFDHIFGFSNLKGTGIDGRETTADGADPASATNIDHFGPILGFPVPVSTPADFALAQVNPPNTPNKSFPDPPHEFHDTMICLCGRSLEEQWQAGQRYPGCDNSGFIDNYRIGGTEAGTPTPSTDPLRIMRCFRPDQLPVLNQLANEFAVCDAWFSSLPGPTWPNRFFLLAGSSGGLDASPSTLDIVTGTTVDGYRFENGTIFDSLDSHCTDWRIFHGDDFPISSAISGMTTNAALQHFSSMDDFASDVAQESFAPKFVFIEPRYGAHKFDIMGPGDMTCGNSMHAPDDVTSGEALVKQVYEGIRNSPHWEKSVLLVLFDEHGGFYDHVKPPDGVPPGDTITENYHRNGFLFDKLGVRVPAIVISPFIHRNTIDHTRYDHTSMLKTVELLLGLSPLTDRDRSANDFLHLFSLDAARDDTPATLVPPAKNPNPLKCDDDAKPRDQSQDELLTQRSELRDARRTGFYAKRPVSDFALTGNQTGFAQIALLQIVRTTRSPERERWIEQYKNISTGIDAALFMNEAQLKLRFGLDMKSYEPPPTA